MGHRAALHAPAAASSRTPGSSVRPINVGLAAPVNAGITAFDLKKVPLLHARYQVYVQVALGAGATRSQNVVVEPQVGGLPLARRRSASPLARPKA